MAGALGFLAGLGQAAGGLPTGLQAAQTEEDKQKALALQQQQIDASRFADVPLAALPSAVRATMPQGAATSRVPTQLIGPYAKESAEERALEAEQRAGSAQATAAEALGTPEAKTFANYLRLGGGRSKEGMASLQQMLGMKAKQDEQDYQTLVLNAIRSGEPIPIRQRPSGATTAGPAPLGPPKIQATGMETAPPPYAQNPDVLAAGQELRQNLAPAIKAGVVPPPRPGEMPAGPAAATPSGKEAPDTQQEYTLKIGDTTVHIKPKAQANAQAEFVKALDMKQAFDAQGVPPTDPRYRVVMERMNELRPLLAPPGTGIVTRGSMPWNMGAGGTTPGSPEVTTPNAPISSDAEAEKVGMRNAAVTMLESAAKKATTFPSLEGAGARTSLRLRGWLQGNTPFEALSSDEQRWVTMHEQLRGYFTVSQYGLGPFRSPEMQAQLKEVIGKYWSPGTPERLQELANILRSQGEAVQGAQTAGGRRALPGAPGSGTGIGAGANPPGGASGGGIVQKWGRDAQGNPVRLP